MEPEIGVSRLMRIVFGLALLSTIAIGAVNNVDAVSRLEGRPDITDFHAFYIVGQTIWAGHFAQAYHASAMFALEQALGGRPVFMPWSYPPLFGAVVAALALLPLGIAFVFFVCATLALYLWAIARLDPEGCWPVMLASTVSIVLNLRCGQNGLMTAGVVAAASGCLLAGRPVRSGLCLAAMVVKPHLVPLLPMVLALQRRWLALAVAAIGGAALTGLGVILFGAGMIAEFLHALPNVSRLMLLGAYPLHRMTSIFAFCIGLGLPAVGATLIHGAVAAAVLIAAARLAWLHDEPRLQLGLAIMAGFFVSPYVYDYDQVLFGIGLLLVSPAIRLCGSAQRYRVILAAWALAQSLGFLMNNLVEHNPDVILSPMGPAILAVFCGICRSLRRPDPHVVAAGTLPRAEPA